MDVDEFNLLGVGNTQNNLQNFMNKNDPTLDLMQFMQLDGNNTMSNLNQTANLNFTSNLGQLNLLQQENASLQQQVQIQQQQIQQLTQQLNQQKELINTMQQSSNQIQSLNNIINQKQQQLKEYDDNLNQLIVENSRLEQENIKLKSLTGSVPGNVNIISPILNNLLIKLNSFILETNIKHDEVTEMNVELFIDFVLQNCIYLLKKQNKMDAENRQLQIQSERVKELCQQNIALIRKRVEQLLFCRINILNFEEMELVKVDSQQALKFRDVNGQLHLIDSNYLTRSQCQGKSLGDIIKNFIFR